MPDDPDTDVVKIIVGKDRYIPLIVSQSVTQVTAGLAVERFQPRFAASLMAF
jgi:hypothetical protein